MGDYNLVRDDDAQSYTAGAAITGGQLLEVSADNTVIPAGGVNRAVFVAAHDAGTGQRVTCWGFAGRVHETPVTGTKALVAGNPVIAAAAGALDTAALATSAAAGTLLGVCTRGGTGPAKAQWVAL